jgi:hypothetical protein
MPQLAMLVLLASLAGAASQTAAPGRQGGPRGGGAPTHVPAWLLVSPQRDGSFTVTNPRNSFSKTYGAATSR